MDHLHRRDVDRYVIEKTKQGRSPMPIRLDLGFFRRMLVVAKSYELIDKVADFRVPSPPPGDVVALAPDEAKRLRETAAELYERRLAVLFELYLRTGLRCGEALALYPGDFDLDSAQPTVQVSRSWSRRGYGPTKGKKIRVVPLAPSLAGRVDGLLRERGLSPRSETEHPFSAKNDTHMLRHTTPSAMLRAARMDNAAVTVTTHVGQTRPTAFVDGTAELETEAELLRAGTRLGRYVIDAHVGAGAMGRIYSAYDPKLDRKVAIKLLRAERNDEVGRDRLLREARALAKLAHPHVVAVYDVGTVGDRVFVAMEYVEGTTLTQALARARHRWREILELMIPVAEGLAAVHAAGLVHRDLKPDNIMLGDDGRVRLMDFGLARAATHPTLELEPTAPASGELSETPTLTGTGMRIGTPPYMAPEQWRGEPADARTDQFAFCVSSWEALYGERPFRGRASVELERAITSGLVSTPARAAKVPRWLNRALLRGMSVDPGDRHRNMDTLIAVLMHGRRRVRIRWLAVAVGLVATVAAGIGWGATKEPTDAVADLLPEPLEHCEANEVCAAGPLAVPMCTRADGEAAGEGKPCTLGEGNPCPERESCVATLHSEGEVGRCLPVCEVADDRPECVPGCYNQQCAGKFDVCAREHGTCQPVPCATDDQCSSVAACDFPERGGMGFRCNVEAGLCEREPVRSP